MSGESVSCDYLQRRDRLREALDRALIYYRAYGRDVRAGRAVDDACATMLFDATEAERAEMIGKLTKPYR